MATFSEYSLPVQGLKTGIHNFKYALDGRFYRRFESSPVQEGAILFDVEVDKRHDMFVLQFTLEGWIQSECDRCTVEIKLPMSDEQVLFVKYTEDQEEDDDEVVFISREAAEFNIAKYLYEFTVLALPMTNTYDCENDDPPPCNFEVLRFLNQTSDEDDDDDTDGSGNPIWDALKDLK